MSGGSVGRTRRLVRALAYRRLQTLLVGLISALLAGTAVFAPWFNRLVDDAATRSAFARDAPGSTWTITTSGAGELEQHVPATTRHLFTGLVEGRQAAILWQGAQAPHTAKGGLVTRDDICEHLVLVEGTCPVEPGEIAVSTADAELWGVRNGDVLTEISSRHDDNPLTVTGLYRLENPDDPYWFDEIPTSRSGWEDLEQPVSDLFVTQPATFDDLAPGPDNRGGRPFMTTLDIRVDPDVVTVDDLDVLARDAKALRGTIGADGNDASLSTTMDDTLEDLDRSRRVAATTLALVLAQIGVLALAVLTMLVGLVLLARRPELGLARLRGHSVRRLVGAVSVEWLAVVVAGSAVGVVLGYAAARVAATRLPTEPALVTTAWVAPALLVTIMASVALMAVRSRQVASEPVPALLRSTQPRSAGGGPGAVALDAILVTAAVCGAVVGLQSPADSALVILTPSLLALAAGVLLARLVRAVAARAGRRALDRGRTATTLAAIQLARSRGLAPLLCVLCAATAFTVFSTQVGAAEERNRAQRAEVEAGAALVARTDSQLPDVVAALDAVDPRREQATVVVTTRVSDESALSLMLVEPEAFRRIGYAAADVASAADWRRIKAPDVAPVELTGIRLSATVDTRGLFARGEAEPALTVKVGYLDTDGTFRSATLGPFGRGLHRAETAISCAEGCKLVRWTFQPDGGADGKVVLSDLRTDAPLDLGPSTEWQSVVGDAEGYRLEITTSPGQLGVDLRSGGRPVLAQHRFQPADLAAVLSAEHPTLQARPTVDTPAGTALPLRTVATARDAVPRALRDVAVADLEAVLRLGELGRADRTGVQVWFAEGTDRAALTEDFAEQGVALSALDDVDAHRDARASRPEALVGDVGPVAATLALALAALAMLLSVASSWRSRSRDLAALRLVGVPRRSLLAATYAVELGTAAVALAAGALTGVAGYALAIGQVPLVADPEPAIALDLGVDGTRLVLMLLGTAALLALVALGCSQWLIRRSVPGRIRQEDA